VIRPDEHRYRRLLRWYPRAWRATNGEVLLGILLDDAEAQGRVVPTTLDRFRAARDGTGSRLTGRLAVGSSFLGLGMAALAGLGSVWGTEVLTSAGAWWVVSVITTVVAPTLVLLALVCLARERTLLTEGRALAVLVLSAPALGLGVLSWQGWGQGFDAADDGIAATGLGAVWAPLLMAGWVFGSLTCALVLDALFARAGLRGIVRVSLSVSFGILLALCIMPLLVMPSGPALAAAIVAAIALRVLRPSPPAGKEAVPVERSTPIRRAPLSPSASRGSRSLAVLSAIGSTIGVVYAFTGSQWSPAAVDSTLAMGRGISIALLCGVPLLAALGMRLAARSARPSRHTWGPLALIGLWFGAVAGGYTNGADGSLGGGFALGAVLAGGALAWWMTPRLRGPWKVRVAFGSLAGLACAAFLGLVLAPMLAFAVPIGAILLAVWRPRRPRGTEASLAPAPALAR